MKISYDISYGYEINISGNGISTIHYEEYLPHSLNGLIQNITVQPQNTVEIDTLGNQKIIWNQTLNQTSLHRFTISSSIVQEPIIIADLSGKKSLSIPEIHNLYPTLAKKYTQKTGNDTVSIINPSDPAITHVAQQIHNHSKTNNAFIIAKHLFSYLKNQTNYEKHASSKPQPAQLTFQTGVGDCDDLSYLYLSLCRAVGIPSRYVKGYLVSASNIVPHVWAEIFVGKQITGSGWIPVECAGTGNSESEIHNHFGMQDVYHLRLSIDDGTNQSFQRLLNPIKIEYEPGITISINRAESISNFKIKSSKQMIIEDHIRTYD